MATEPFNCRIFGHFREGIASGSSLLQGGYLKQKIEIKRSLLVLKGYQVNGQQSGYKLLSGG